MCVCVCVCVCVCGIPMGDAVQAEGVGVVDKRSAGAHVLTHPARNPCNRDASSKDDERRVTADQVLTILSLRRKDKEAKKFVKGEKKRRSQVVM